MVAGLAGKLAKRFFTRLNASRADVAERHVPMACSTGARARAMRIDPAIMTPGVIAPCNASRAPAPSMLICSRRRIIFEAEVKAPLRLLARAARLWFRNFSVANGSSSLAPYPWPI